MSHPTRLAWLPLATRDEAVSTASSSVGHSIAAVPEFWRDPMVDHVSQHVDTPAVLNQPERIPAELEISSLPALALYRNGEFVKFIGGMGKQDAIAQQVERLLEP